MESYTIKQAADALGISKQAVRYHLKKIGGQFRKDERGIAVIPTEVFEEIRARVGGKEVVNGDSLTGKQVVNESDFTGKKPVKCGDFAGKEVVNDDLFTGKQEASAESVALAVLREQIENQQREIDRLNAKLDEKERRIDELTDKLSAALDKAQVLHAATVKQLQEATTGTDEPVTVDETQSSDPDEPEQRKKGLFWWLNRSK